MTVVNVGEAYVMCIAGYTVLSLPVYYLVVDFYCLYIHVALVLPNKNNNSNDDDDDDDDDDD